MLSVLVWLSSNLVKIKGLTTQSDKIALCNNIGAPALNQIEDNVLVDACSLFKSATDEADDYLLAQIFDKKYVQAKLLSCISNPDLNVHINALRAVSNMLTSEDSIFA